ncbi:hypothetical protein PGB90_007841 [Kerria lacca]
MLLFTSSLSSMLWYLAETVVLLGIFFCISISYKVCLATNNICCEYALKKKNGKNISNHISGKMK